MAESLVQVTEGVGKKLHTNSRTIGANTVEDEVMLLGENYLASYIAVSSAAAISTATAASHLFTINAGASLKVRIRRIELYQVAAVTTAAFMDTRLIRTTTAAPTGGTVQTTNVLEPGDAASGATVMSLPTVKATEGNTIHIASVYMMQTIGASTPLLQPIMVWDFDRPRSKPLIISAGTTNGLCIKNVNAIAAGTLHCNVWFDETSF
jgi:hypothetical protein